MEGRNSLDVAVVGGSAAGFFAARVLARAGRRVQVFEAADRLGPTSRTLIVTSQMRRMLGEMGESSVVNEIRRFELFGGGRVATIPIKRPDLIIERSRIIRALAEEAEAAGATICLGHRFVHLRPNGQGLTLLFNRNGVGMDEVHAGTIIGADGAFSTVGQVAGWPRQPTVPLVQAIVRLPKDQHPDTTRVWFLPEDTAYFYWLIPDSPKQGALGLIGEDGKQARECLERFLDRQGIEPLEYQAARIPLYMKWVPVHRKVGEGNVYLVGDAAGQVKVTTVGGIVTGLRGALGVAEAILNGGSSPELRALRRELSLHLLIRKALHQFGEADYGRLLGLLGQSARRSLSVHTRDETPKLLLNLLVGQPRLLLLGLRGLLLNSGFPSRGNR